MRFYIKDTYFGITWIHEIKTVRLSGNMHPCLGYLVQLVFLEINLSQVGDVITWVKLKAVSHSHTVERLPVA